MAKRVGAQSFIKIFNKFTFRFSPWEVWKDFIVTLACALSNSTDKLHYDEREALYIKTIQKYDEEERNIFPQLAAETVLALEENPEQDFLGNIFMNLGLGNKDNGQFFTPYHVCELMAKTTISDILPHIEKEGFIKVCDPCCGAGATLIASIHEIHKRLKGKYNWQNHVLIVGQDIDYATALMCYIQLSLLGAAAYIKIGNTLTEPICSNDALENYWFTPMYFSGVWTIRRLLRGKELL